MRMWGKKRKVTSEIKNTNIAGVPNIAVGQKFGKLTVLNFAYKKRNQRWNLKCECGNEHVVLQML